jgi:hypothetical protein
MSAGIEILTCTSTVVTTNTYWVRDMLLDALKSVHSCASPCRIASVSQDPIMYREPV